MKAIVHIGTEKTGTTSIQKFLYQNRKKLRKGGYHFLQCAGKTNNRALPAYCLDNDRMDDFYRLLDIMTVEDRLAHKRAFIREFEHELAGLPKHIHTVVISSEHFHSRIRTEREMDNVHELLTTYFDDIQIVCYLRDQISTCTSYYSTALKSGNPSSFADFIERCKPQNYYFNYLMMLENWERCFGLDALNVSLFSRDLFLNGSLLDDLTAKIDPKLVGVLDTSIDVENESLTPAGQALARAVNIAFPIRAAQAESDVIREKCKRLINDRFRGKGREMSAAAQQEVFSAFESVNETLRQKFFPDMESILQPPGVKAGTEVVIDESFVAGFLAVLKIVQTDGRGVIESQEYADIYRSIFSSVNEVLYDEEKDDADNAPSLTRDNLRFLRNVALQVEHRDKPAALKLLKLVHDFEPSLPGVAQRLETHAAKERKNMAQGNKKNTPQHTYMIRYTVESETMANARSDEMEERFRQWLAIVDKVSIGSAFNLLQGTRTIKSDGSVVNESADLELGFTIIQATTLEEAQTLASKCPQLEVGGKVEVSLMVAVT